MARLLAAAALVASASAQQEYWFDDLLSHLRVPSEFKLSVFTDKVGGVRSIVSPHTQAPFSRRRTDTTDPVTPSVSRRRSRPRVSCT